MGTSQSSKGPGGGSPLVPPWADDQPQQPLPSPQERRFAPFRESLGKAYDIFLELAADNLDPADVLLFNLQFEERGGAELFDPAEDWQEHVDFDLNPDFFAEVVIGLADSEDGEINDVFARILLCREKDHKLCHIIWRE